MGSYTPGGETPAAGARRVVQTPMRKVDIMEEARQVAALPPPPPPPSSY
jgi:hypothetical protein